MIAKGVPSRQGTRTFANGIAYVQKHEHRHAPELVGVGVSFTDRVSYASADEKAAWTHTRGVSSVATAPGEMEAVARLSTRCADPVQHEIIAYAKDERPTRAQMVADAERLLSALDMADHQYVMSVHTDTDDLHAHIIANRVGADGKANARWQDRPARERLCAQIAAERGWGIVVGFHNRDIVQEHLSLPEFPPEPRRRVFDRDFDRAHGRGVLPWQDAARPYVLGSVERASSWDELRARLDLHGVVLKAIERGGRFQGLAFAEGLAPDAPGCAASRIDARCKLSALEARFGPYDAPTPQLEPTVMEKPGLWRDGMRPVILEAAEQAESWGDLRARLAAHNVVLKGVERGGRLAGLAFAARSDADAPGCGASRIADRCKLSALEARFGAYPDRPQERSPAENRRAVEPARTLPEERTTRERAAARESKVPSPSPLRERVERDVVRDPEWALKKASNIAENARMREEYGRYRDAFFADRRERAGERREAAWRNELVQRRAESERRWEAKQTQRAVARALAPRGIVRNAAYGVVEHIAQRRAEHDRARAHARWEGVKAAFTRERDQERTITPLRYRDFIAERAQTGDDGARRVQAYLDGHVRNGRAEQAPRLDRDEPKQRPMHRVAIRDVRAELLERLSEEARIARQDASAMPGFLALHKRYEAVVAQMDALERRGVRKIALEPERGGTHADRLAQVEEAVQRADRGEQTPSLDRDTPESRKDVRALQRVSIEETRDRLLHGMAIEARTARIDPGYMPEFLALRERHAALEEKMRVLEERGVTHMLVQRDDTGMIEERFPLLERAVERLGNAAENDAEMTGRVHQTHEPDSYGFWHEKLAEIKIDLAARTADLTREKDALGEYPAPMPLDEQIRLAEAGMEEGARYAAAFTPAEERRYGRALRECESWNPLARGWGERTERALVALRDERYGAAFASERHWFEAAGLPVMIGRFEERNAMRESWERDCRRIEDQMHTVKDERSALHAAFAALDVMERAGVPAPAFDRDAIAQDSEMSVDHVRSIIERAKDERLVETGHVALGWALEAIVDGRDPEAYREEERNAAIGLLKQIKELSGRSSTHIVRESDMHRVLAQPERVEAQVTEAVRAQAQERSRELSREHDFGLEL